MRILYLLRHAKSSWKDETLSDFDRPLKGRGRKAAEHMGQVLAEEKLKSPLVISSPAVRARETAELVLESADLGVEPRFDERIYEADVRTLLEVVRSIPASANTAIMVGHNPGFADLLRLLVSDGDRLGFTKAMKKYPTAGLAVIDLPNGAWRELSPRSGRLDRFVTPKSLGLGEDE